MTFSRDPAEMTPAERLREIAGLLARGYLRLLTSRIESRNRVDIPPEIEPPWPRLVNRTESTPGQEGFSEERDPSDRGAS